MVENGKIGVRQFTILVVLYTIGDAILILPAITAGEAKQDAWIVAILSIAVGLMVLPLYSAVGRLHPDLTLVQLNEKIFGKWLGIIASLLFLSYCFLYAAVALREIGDFMTTHIMPDTPIEAIHIVFVMIILMATRLGLETIARSAEILFPWVIILLFILIIFLLPEVKVEKVQPVLEEGFKPILRGSLTFITYPFVELVVLMMIFPFVNQSNKINKSLLIGAGIGGLALAIMITLCLLVLGPDLTARYQFPSYMLAKKINIGNFLQRIEAILAGIWFITLFFRITFYFYSAVLGLAQTLRLKEYRSLTLPMGVILVNLSLMISPNIVYIGNMSPIWPFYDFTYGILLPLLLFGVAAMRRFSKGTNDRPYSG
ncbi:endospore germination permease [Ammoniphilus sp. YIM 78166]|uniref:GerAB/ArcD/ProY family transporter n=1 Tax=Ammoniphilus sp. YIM 78166 TaxID=1644106 RepID=UPI00106FDD30|nr:endospore germination permease [Ammoniphilus sp. YIM 78166]